LIDFIFNIRHQNTFYNNFVRLISQIAEPVQSNLFPYSIAGVENQPQDNVDLTFSKIHMSQIKT
jgi:hypothetical protein